MTNSLKLRAAILERGFTQEQLAEQLGMTIATFNYYDGKKAVPAWVRKKQWIVLQVKGDRAVIDKSVDGENSIESPISTKYLTVVKSTTTTPQKAFEPYLVKINTAALNIRKGAGTNYDVVDCIRDRGVYTIVDESTGSGAKKWGKLKSGAGWISLDYCIKR